MLRTVTYRKACSLWKRLSLLHAFSKVTLSESCVKRLREIGEDDGLLRVMVDSGGCSGFQYKFLIEKNINEDDHVITQSGARVVIDDQSFSLLDGSTLEYEEELIRSGFRVTKNPQAEKGCSCGSSFAVRLD